MAGTLYDEDLRTTAAVSGLFVQVDFQVRAETT